MVIPAHARIQRLDSRFRGNDRIWCHGRVNSFALVWRGADVRAAPEFLRRCLFTRLAQRNPSSPRKRGSSGWIPASAGMTASGAMVAL
jgi:hypothetical protein